MSEVDVLLHEAIAKVCNVDVERVRPETPLADLGLDSLAAAEVLVEVEIALSRELPVDLLRRLDDVKTVGDISNGLQAALGDGPRTVQA